MEIQKTLDNPPKCYVADNIIAERVVNAACMESATLLTIFPSEIWLQVLQSIFHPRDLHHLQQSSPFFNNLLMDIKTKALFPEVIKIIAAKLNSSPKDTWDILLKCRSICRAWEFGVDLVLNNFWEYQNVFDRPGITSGFVSNMTITSDQLRSKDDAERFLNIFDEKYATRNRNPFLCRSVEMHEIYSERDFQVFTPQALKIFGLYGHKISRFSLTYDIPYAVERSGSLSIVSHFEHLPQLLHQMPNLKVLELNCHLGPRSKRELEDLVLSMHSCVFPALNNLRHLDVQNLPTPVFDNLLKSYSHVTMLSVCNISNTSSNLSLFAQPMPNLTQLELVVDDNTSLILLEISNVQWPLTSLSLQVETAVFDWQKLFRILKSRWAATLTELNIEADYFWKYQPCVLPSLNLPNLRVFMLYAKHVVPLDFILPMANSLGRLVVRYSLWNQGEPELINEQVIKFYTFRKNLMKSNIWILFPKLKIAELYATEFGPYPNLQTPTVHHMVKRVKENCFEKSITIH